MDRPVERPGGLFMRRLFLPLAVGAAALALAAALDLALFESLRARPFDVGYVPTGPAARVAALGHRTLLSDLYWLETVQYIGDSKGDERGYDKLLPLLELVTDLDPRHGYAYQTGGIVLSAVGRLDESDQILAKGVEKGPPYWTFGYYLAFNAWFYRGDYETAARWARVAAKTPGASANISQLALSLSSKSGSPEAAIATLRELRATVHDELTASKLDEQLNLAALERDAQALERAVERFRATQERDPITLHELVTAGLVPGIPQDPFGGEYRWDPAERRIHSTANSFRFSRPAAPQAPSFAPPTGIELGR
jgi:tetratricopeptide (TPR) repeat protein